MSPDVTHELVIANGRVMDPESGLDAVRNVGVDVGTVAAISAETLRGHTTIDAEGLVVAPGFIDLHSHGQNDENYRIQARDGVTTALELEVGTADIDLWYSEREGTALLNFGASVGHIPIRMAVIGDTGDWLPVGDAVYRKASEDEVAEMGRRIERGLKRGAPAVGFGIQYTPGATRWEILEAFRVAARYGASCHVHMRGMGPNEPNGSVEALEEVVAASSITGAPLHVVHLSSTGLRAAPQLLQMIGEAQALGLDVTTECYPYGAGMTAIDSAVLDEGWQDRTEADFGDLEWAATGERLTAQTFAAHRETGGLVIAHIVPEDVVEKAVVSPLTMIATDGLIQEGKGHPRTAGSYSRLLGRFVREQRVLSLMDALRKASLMPARRLVGRVPELSNKGCVRVGADADLVLFDPNTVIDTATYPDPTRAPVGIHHVLVNGVPVVRDGTPVEGVNPGKPVRGPLE